MNRLQLEYRRTFTSGNTCLRKEFRAAKDRDVLIRVSTFLVSLEGFEQSGASNCYPCVISNAQRLHFPPPAIILVTPHFLNFSPDAEPTFPNSELALHSVST